MTLPSPIDEALPLRRFDEESRTLAVVTGGHFLSHFYLLAFPPLFPLLRSDLSLNNTQLGLIVSLVSVAMLLQVIVGEFVDRIGAKRVFVAGVAMTALGIGAAGFANSYPALLAAAAVSGLGQSTFHPADYPLVEAVSDDGRLGRNFGIHSFGGYLGFAVAPVVVGGLGLAYGWQAALWLAGAVGLGYAVLAAVTLPPLYRRGTVDDLDESGPEVPSAAAFLRPGILVMSAFFLVVTMAEKGVQAFTTLLTIDGFGFAETVGNSALSGFFAATAVAVLVGGFVADRADPARVIAVTTAIAAGTLLLVVGEVVPISPTSLIALFVVAGGAYGLVFASRDRLVTDSAADNSTGRSFGFVFTASSIGSLSSPVLLGAISDAASTLVAFLLVSVFFLASGVIAIGYSRL
ncbi:MFS transporter [haloarchaeon 3A1-DGR]|nr:MFS transporter [haloarchaeon 3A1-DGR]